MTDKQQIEEIAMALNYRCKSGCGTCYSKEYCGTYKAAKALYNAGYRKVEQDYAELLHEYESVSNGLVEAMELVHKIKAQRDVLKQQLAEARKETAKDFIFKVESYLGYEKDNETFTKKELLLILAEVAREQYDVEVEE